MKPRIFASYVKKFWKLMKRDWQTTIPSCVKYVQNWSHTVYTFKQCQMALQGTLVNWTPLQFMHPIPSSSYTKAGLLCAMLIISCPLKNYCSCTFKMWHFGGGHRPQFTSSLRRKLIKSERFYSTDIITTSALDDRKLIKTTSVSKKDRLCTSGRPVRRN